MQKIAQKLVGRLDVFDLLRGYFVLVLVIDHHERWPGLFEWVTGRAQLWATAAEGFFIVSGIMIGLIRGQRMIGKPMRDITKLLLHRSFQLYLWAVLSSLFFTLWAMLWYLYTGQDNISFALLNYTATNGWELVLQTFTFQYSHGWTGFLKYYALFIALAPIVVWLLRRGLWWLVLAASAGLWLYGLDKDSWWLSWQVLFYGGAVVGYHVSHIQEWWHKLSSGLRVATETGLYTISVLTVTASAMMTFAWPIVKQPGNWFMSFDEYVRLKQIIDPLFDIVTLQPLRLLMAILWFTALLFLFKRFEPFIKRWLGWLLMTYGQNSLYVYILHGIFPFAFNMLLPTREYFIANVAIVAFSIMSLWWLTKKRFLMNFIPR